MAEIKRESVASQAPCLPHFSATRETEQPRAAPRAQLNPNGLICPHCRSCCIDVVLVGLRAEGNLCWSLSCYSCFMLPSKRDSPHRSSGRAGSHPSRLIQAVPLLGASSPARRVWPCHLDRDSLVVFWGLPGSPASAGRVLPSSPW